MEGTEQVTNPILKQKRLLHRADELVNRRLAAADQFKAALLVASNAIQASRMLDNLQIVLDRKNENDDEATALEHDLADARVAFRQAIQNYDENEIFDAEGRIEQLTLFHDPFYLEGEEVRKKEYFEKKRRAGIRKATWATNPSSRFVSLLKGDIEGVEEVTEEEQRSCISKCAWGFAIIGMIIAISFLIADFWSAQANPALRTNLIRHEQLKLPVVYACISLPNIPTFQDLPNGKYPGTSLWGLRSYTHEDSKETLLYPKTKSITEPSFLGRSECSNSLKFLSKEAIVKALDAGMDQSTRCHSCLKIGAKTPIRLYRDAAIRRPSGGVTLEFATSRILEFCFNPAESLNTMLRSFLRDTLKAEGEKLVNRGIITIIESPYIDFAFDFGFEDFKTAFPDSSAPRLNAEASVLCNLYLFSGYFFPVKPGTETRYTYDINGGLESWKGIGNNGDTSHFLKVEQDFTIRESLDVNRSAILQAMRGADSTSGVIVAETSIRIFKVDDPLDPPGAYKDFAASLRRNHRDVLLFTKSMDAGVSTYTSSLQYGMRKVFRAVGTYRRYNISLDYKTFETEVITRSPTTSTAEFLTDIFEYVGLFTGICAYSVLVGPARMYLKRKPNQKNGNNQ